MDILLFVDVRVVVNVTPPLALDIRDNLQDIVFVGQVVVVQLQLFNVVIVPAVVLVELINAIGVSPVIVLVVMLEHTIMV
jgi:hypothetical protein